MAVKRIWRHGVRVRWEFSRLGAPQWSDKPVALIGGGASIKGVDLSSLADAHTIAVKGTMFDYPWAEMAFGLDSIDLGRWWRNLNDARMPVWWAVDPRRWRDPTHKFFPRQLRLIRRQTSQFLSNDPSIISSGGTSGFGALNVAYLKGARLVVLFGYDYSAVNGEWHANGAHYDPNHFYNPVKWEEWAATFGNVVSQLSEKGVEVVNASPRSGISAFPKVSIEEGLRLCQI